MRSRIILLVLSTIFLACSEQSSVNLNISFDDPKWDGEKVPKEGQCKNCGGGGLSPALRVKNIPPESNLLIVEFNDKSMPGLSKGGGHGAIRFKVENKTEFVAPSMAEQTFELPEGIEMESPHGARIGKPGAYMAPCGCGSRNKYEATVFAIKGAPSGERTTVDRGEIVLGKF